MWQTPTGQSDSPAPSPTNALEQSTPWPSGGPEFRVTIGIAAATMILGYFLPWLNFLGKGVSGSDLAQSGEFTGFWILPVTAACTLLLVTIGRPTELVRRLAGLSPFAFLFYGVMQLGSGLVKELQVGAWLCLFSGLVLIFLPCTFSTPSSQGAAAPTPSSSGSPAGPAAI